MTDLIVSRVDKARLLLSQASTAQDAKKVADLGKAAKVYAERQKLGEEAISFARAVIVDAQTLMGEFLAGAPKNGGGNPKLTGAHREPVAQPPTLAEIGITKKESSSAQFIYKLSKEDEEAHQAVRAGLSTLSEAKKKAVQQARREAIPINPVLTSGICSDLGDLIKAGKQFGCIYADPPWQYDNQGTRASTDNHYETLTVEQVCEMPVIKLAADRCHLHLWTTNAFLFDCRRIMEAWGFDFKSSFVWVKPQIGMGNYWRNSHEILLLGSRGGLTAASKAEKSWLEADRAGHSEKPQVVRKSIERLSPGPYLELFGRAAVKNWTVFGNQIAS